MFANGEGIECMNLIPMKNKSFIDKIKTEFVCRSKASKIYE